MEGGKIHTHAYKIQCDIENRSILLMTDISEIILPRAFLCNTETFPNHHLIVSLRLTAKVICASLGQTVFTLWQYFCIWSDRRWENKHHLFASITTAFTCQPRAHACAPVNTFHRQWFRRLLKNKKPKPVVSPNNLIPRTICV